MSSWQTTVAGLGCIAAGVYLITLKEAASVGEGVGLIAAGLGLIRAKDANVHSTEGEVKVATAEKTADALKAANQ